MIFKKFTLKIYSIIIYLFKELSNAFFKYLSKLYQYYFINFKNSGLTYEIDVNRKNKKNISTFISKQDYNISKDRYGLPQKLTKYIDKDHNNFPTYTDLILFLFKFFNQPIVYLEIGVSVLKNFYLISAGATNNKLYAFDINKINPAIEKKFNKTFEGEQIKIYNFNENSITYFQGDVFNKNDLFQLENLISSANFIFSDAHHSYDGVISEYNNLIKNILEKDFIIYYDDLSKEIKTAFFEIAHDLSKKYKLNVVTFLINGWLGENEKMHRNGIISNLKINKIFQESKINLLELKYHKKPFYKIQEKFN